MLTKRTRQAITATFAFCCCTGGQQGQVHAAQLRATTGQDRQAGPESQIEDINKRQTKTSEVRQLGDVILVDGANNNYKEAYPEFTEPDSNFGDGKDLPMVRSGPNESEEPISVNPKKMGPGANTKEDEFEMQDRVVGGRGVGPHPFYAMLLYKDASGWKFAGCGATLITNCHVVTAAHCVEDRNFEIDGIYQNAHTPYNGNSNYPFHFTNAKKIFVPQEYDDFTNVNDIAIIRLTECVDISVYPPALPASPGNQKVVNGDMLELYGFGRLGENLGNSGDTKQLQMAEMPYISNTQCKEYFGDKIKSGMFCAGYPQTGGVDACQGDSGSGIILPPTNSNGQPILMGVVSWGVGCARKEFPGVYANVADFYGWIKANTCNDPDLDPSISWCNDSSEEGNTLMLRESGCSSDETCQLCEGHCQTDRQCSDDLQCFRRTEANPFDLVPGCLGTGVSMSNYCYDPNLSRFSDQGNNDKLNAKQYREIATAVSSSGYAGRNDATTFSNTNKYQENSEKYHQQTAVGRRRRNPRNKNRWG